MSRFYSFIRTMTINIIESRLKLRWMSSNYLVDRFHLRAINFKICKELTFGYLNRDEHWTTPDKLFNGHEKSNHFYLQTWILQVFHYLCPNSKKTSVFKFSSVKTKHFKRPSIYYVWPTQMKLFLNSLSRLMTKVLTCLASKKL